MTTSEALETGERLRGRNHKPPGHARCPECGRIRPNHIINVFGVCGRCLLNNITEQAGEPIDWNGVG